ncbi:hypothetical protein CKAH01_13714 [Colletotrichum kahawae]|uniref:F-box domain-containing protein n=1 Tax=Colletotrichum kahawae TaxID=34407 RepID=A0AAE0DDJ7_COLKA|nr:hypothetical protein CKAH01_13714 [Colletotrichum kahawae]
MRTLKKQRSTLKLPPEIILLIIHYLPTESVLSFTLTCRLFYISFFPKSLILSPLSKSISLTMLERDIPYLLYCPECITLHSWQRFSRPGGLLAIHSKRPCSKTAFRPPFICGKITYQHIRLVMNHHLYGDSHGLPVHTLSESRHWQCGATGVDFQYSRQARIINNNLFLITNQTMHHPTNDTIQFEKYLRVDGGRICYHRNIWDTPRYYSSISQLTGSSKLHDKHPPLISLPKFLMDAQCGRILSCPVCLTDAQVSIKWSNKFKRWSVEMVAWRQFGDCRSPFDLQWESMTIPGSEGPTEELRAQEHPPGIVRYRWSKGDTKLSDMNSYFVG